MAEEKILELLFDPLTSFSCLIHRQLKDPEECRLSWPIKLRLTVYVRRGYPLVGTIFERAL